MTKPIRSLADALIRPLLLGCSLAFLLGTALSVYIVQIEYDELLDLSLRAKAELLLPLMAAEYEQNPQAITDHLGRIEGTGLDVEEKASFWLVDAQNRTIVQSTYMPTGLNNDAGRASGFAEHATHRYFTTPPNADGVRLVIAEPLIERNEAVMDSLFGIALSMAILVIIAFVVIRLAIRYLQRTISSLSDTIRQKNEFDLAPIDPSLSFSEMYPAVETINDLMSRLGKAVESERNFATNAAHELRTPLAVSLAHTQRLKAATSDPDVIKRTVEVETGLKKLIHLVERLLQFSRAQSGLGTSEELTDVSVVTTLMFNEAARRSDAQDRIAIHPPITPFFSSIDPDALAIILSNLIDNALKHSQPNTMVELDGRTEGEISISNDCEPLSESDQAKIQERYLRQSARNVGFGVGMAIVKTLCEQSGSKLTIESPRPGSRRGITVKLQFPEAAGLDT
ncbi:MAG: HAMP domain-containing sensor histidine kinase [Albidovulum sp.]